MPYLIKMLSRQPVIRIFALLLFTVFQVCLFRTHISNVEYIVPGVTIPTCDTPPTKSKNEALALDSVLPDVVLQARIRQVSMRVYNITNATTDALDERCMATHVAHGKRWGYPTHILREDVKGKGQWRELVFSKPLYMLAIAVTEMAKPSDERAEWLVFFDSDTILLNPNIPWSLFLPPSDFPNIHFLAGRDWVGFNAGVFFVRINEWSVKMLTEVAALPDLRPDVSIGYNAEQTAFQWVLNRAGYRDHVIYQPIKWFNGFEQSFGHLPTVQYGDLLVHFSGLKDDKFDAVQKWLTRLDHVPHELQVPLDQTKYQANLEAYWACMRDARDVLQKAERVVDRDGVTQELRAAQADLQQNIYDEADRPALVREAIERLKSAYVAVRSPANGSVDKYSEDRV